MYTSYGTGNACVGNLSYLKIFKLFSLGEEDLAVSDPLGLCFVHGSNFIVADL